MADLDYCIRSIYKNGFSKIQKDDKVGIIVQENGKIILEPIYNTIEIDFETLIVKVSINGSYFYSILNKEQKLTQNFLYETSPEFFNKIAIVKNRNLYGVINEKGEILEPIKYEKIEIREFLFGEFEMNNVRLLKKIFGKKIASYCNNKWTIISNEIDEVFDEVFPISKTQIVYRKENLYGLINEFGEVLTKLIFLKIERKNRFSDNLFGSINDGVTTINVKINKDGTYSKIIEKKEDDRIYLNDIPTPKKQFLTNSIYGRRNQRKS